MREKGFDKDFLYSKKAAGLVYSVIIFTILNVVFFSLLFYFVHDTSKGAITYEQSYAKQIAILVNSAEPLSEIYVDFEDGLKIANKK